MNEIKKLIANLTEKEKFQLMEYLKFLVNEEVENLEGGVCECYKCNSHQIVKLGTYDNIQIYRCKNCNTSFTAKSKSIFATTKLEKEKMVKIYRVFC